MRFSLARSSRLPLLACLTAAALVAPACNAIFGITGGVAAGTGGSGGATAASTAASASVSSGTGTGGAPTAASASTGASTSASASGGTGGGASCGDAGAAACSPAGVLTRCDAQGHELPSVPCAAFSLCDPVAQQCSDPGRLSVGATRSCIVDDDQGVHCWGYNDGSPLSLGGLVLGDSHLMFPSPVTIPSFKARQVSVASEFQCALEDSGAVACWGYDYGGVLGVQPNGDALMVNPVPNLPTTAVEVSAATGCACARLADGSVYCWGYQDSGCTGTASTQSGAQWIPQQIAMVVGAVQIRVGDGGNAPSCARLVDHRVVCWGANNTPGFVPGVNDATDIAVGSSGLVFIQRAGGLYWTSPVPAAADAGAPAWTWQAPTPYAGAGQIGKMAAGNSFCGVQAGGAVVCASLFGLSNPPVPPAPTMVTPPTGSIAEIEVGYGRLYAGTAQCLRLSGALSTGVYCWGDDFFGDLGVGGPDYLTAPAGVTGLPSAPTRLSIAERTTSAVLGDGSAWWWGDSGSFQDDNDPAVPTATAIPNLSQNNVVIQSNDDRGEAYALKTAGGPAVFDDGTPELGAQRLQTYTSTNFVDVRYGYSDMGLLPGPGSQVVFYTDQSDGNSCGIFGDGTPCRRPSPGPSSRPCPASRRPRWPTPSSTTARAGTPAPSS